MLVVLFCKCTTALFNPAYRRGESIKWGLVSYTVAMFSLVTLLTAMNLHILSVAYIDHREYPGIEGKVPPGPLGYLRVIYYKAINLVPNAAVVLNNWLANGFLVSSLLGLRSLVQASGV